MEADIGGVLAMVFCEKIERRGETLEGFFLEGSPGTNWILHIHKNR